MSPSTETLIDLDAIGPPASERAGRVAFRWPDLRLWAAVATVLLVGTVAGSVAPAPRLVEEFSFSQSQGAASIVAGDTVYTASIEDGYASLTAHGPAGTRWSDRRRARDSYSLSFQYQPGILALVLDTDAPRRSTTIAYDPMTGAVRWTYDGAPIAWVSTGMILMSRTLVGDRALVFEYAALRRTTGAPVWTERLPEAQPAGALWTIDQRDGGADSLVAVTTGTQTLTVRDLHTGRISASRTVPDPAPLVRNLVTLAADLILVVDSAPAISRISAYDRATMAERWTTTMRPPVLRIGACGRLVCAATYSGLTALDPATGSPLWSHRDTLLSGELDPEHLVVLVQTSRTLVISTATGRSAFDLHGWDVNAEPASGQYRVVSRPDPLDPAGSQLGLLDHDLGTIRPIGHVTGLWRSCLLVGAIRIRCAVGRGNQLRVWRWRAGDLTT